jgi:hypothetical protein
MSSSLEDLTQINQTYHTRAKPTINFGRIKLKSASNRPLKQQPTDLFFFEPSALILELHAMRSMCIRNGTFLWMPRSRSPLAYISNYFITHAWPRSPSPICKVLFFNNIFYIKNDGLLDFLAVILKRVTHGQRVEVKSF